MNFYIEFLDSNFDENSRESFVLVKLNNREIFSGRATCHPDDFCSKYSGCRIAELRAERKALKSLLNDKREELQKLENFVKAVECYKEFDKESKTARCVYRQLNRYKADAKSLTNEITMLERIEKEYIANLDRLNQKEKEQAKAD